MTDRVKIYQSIIFNLGIQISRMAQVTNFERRCKNLNSNTLEICSYVKISVESGEKVYFTEYPWRCKSVELLLLLPKKSDYMMALCFHR